VRAKLKEEHVADAVAAVKRIFAAIEREGSRESATRRSSWRMA